MAKTDWTSEQLYFDNDDYYRDVMADMNLARKSIEMEVYTFEDGVLARRLLSTFKAARQRSVRVRLILDGWGSPLFWNTIGPELDQIGVEIAVHRALPWKFMRHNRGEPKNRWSKFWFRLRRLNRGFHRKVTLIDRERAWVSSLNVTDLHLKEVYGKNAWADIGCRLTGPPLADLCQAFENIFYRRRWFYLRQPRRSPHVILNDSFFRRRYAMFIQKRRLRRAKERIWIQTPYFIPERSILRALYKAAKRKVDIKVIIPEKNDQPIVKLLSYALIQQLLQKGIRVFEYQPRFAHKKVLIVDRLHAIGSTNFNHRSVLHDLEVEVYLTSYATQHQLSKAFLDDLNESTEISIESFGSTSFWYRFLGRVLFFLRFWC